MKAAAGHSVEASPPEPPEPPEPSDACARAIACCESYREEVRDPRDTLRARPCPTASDREIDCDVRNGEYVAALVRRRIDVPLECE